MDFTYGDEQFLKAVLATINNYNDIITHSTKYGIIFYSIGSMHLTFDNTNGLSEVSYKSEVMYRPNKKHQYQILNAIENKNNLEKRKIVEEFLLKGENNGN